MRSDTNYTAENHLDDGKADLPADIPAQAVCVDGRVDSAAAPAPETPGPGTGNRWIAVHLCTPEAIAAGERLLPPPEWVIDDDEPVQWWYRANGLADLTVYVYNDVDAELTPLLVVHARPTGVPPDENEDPLVVELSDLLTAARATASAALLARNYSHGAWDLQRSSLEQLLTEEAGWPDERVFDLTNTVNVVTKELKGQKARTEDTKAKVDRQKKLAQQVKAWLGIAEHQGDQRPEIILSAEEHLVNAAALKALESDPTLFQRGGELVHIVRNAKPGAEPTTEYGIIRPAGAPRIVAVPLPLLRERICAHARFVRRKARSRGKGLGKTWSKTPASPPKHIEQAIAARGEWPFRPLHGVVTAPVLRADGTILDTPGYDAASGLFYDPCGVLFALPETVTLEAAQAARDLLLDIVCDFPFRTPAHRAAWVAYLLTPLARHAFEGPAPPFVVDSNIRGSGKGLLVALVALIATGRGPAVMAECADDNEMRKRITAIALGGDALVNIDNVVNGLGGAAMDCATTSTIWKDRILGRSEMVELPLLVTWSITGNNVQLRGDAPRRACPIRLESPLENPEDRDDFKHPDLRKYVIQNRTQLLAAALTILRGYCAAGRPDMKLLPWGSFEGWSALVRSAVVWCGLPDPGEAHREVRNSADDDADTLRAILAGLHRMDPAARGLTVSQMLIEARAPGYYNAPEILAFRDALFSSCPHTGEGLPGSGAVGCLLRRFRGRVVDGRRLERNGGTKTAVWRVLSEGGNSPPPVRVGYGSNR
jgi:hypothetical protein